MKTIISSSITYNSASSMGGAIPDTIPDYALTFPREEWDNGYGFVRGLGDINHDGFDDIGYIVNKISHLDPKTFGILFGGSNSNVNSVFLETGSAAEFGSICGVGDINADGFDDFIIGYMHFIDTSRHRKDVLYYGNSNGVYLDSLVICDGINISDPFSYPVGDTNWDGHPEFVSSFTGSTAKIYFGGHGFDGTNFVEIAPPYNGTFNGEGFASGDVNGNGTDDLMGTNVTQADGYGDAYLWMGGVPMNGTPDLHIIPGFNYDWSVFGPFKRCLPLKYNRGIFTH
jgi:hypothetical protein